MNLYKITSYFWQTSKDNSSIYDDIECTQYIVAPDLDKALFCVDRGNRVRRIEILVGNHSCDLGKLIIWRNGQ